MGLILPCSKGSRSREAELGASEKTADIFLPCGSLPAGNWALYWERQVFRTNPAGIRAPLHRGLGALTLAMEQCPGFSKQLQENLGMGFKAEFKTGI